MQQIEGCQPGRRGRASLTVGDTDTAAHMGSGDVPVLASPRVLALAEQAAVSAIRGCLADDHTSVGARAELEHSRPTFVGGSVTAEAVLIGVHGRRLEFRITVRDGDGHDVASVRHERAVVARERFGG